MEGMTLDQLESLCERLYNAQDPIERRRAEEVLRVFSSSTEYASQCKAVLDASISPYAQVMASSSLLKMLTDDATPSHHAVGSHPASSLCLDVRHYILAYLARQGPRLQPFVAASMVQLLCRATKLGWFDDDAHRRIVEDCKKVFFFQDGSIPSMDQASMGSQSNGELPLVGLKVLNALVAEMNQPIPGRSLTQHRKCAVNFRDLALLPIFQMAIGATRQCLTRHPGDPGGRGIHDGDDGCSSSGTGGRGDAAMAAMGTMDAGARLGVLDQAVSLALKCLSFDFVGTSLDESHEDLGTIQIPSSWRHVLEDPATMRLFFDAYAMGDPSQAQAQTQTQSQSTAAVSSHALECLVRLACVRRSLFASEAERTRYLAQLIGGTRDVLATQMGLAEHANYHAFCRLLGRLKTNYQLSELVGIPDYGEWIARVADFTVQSLAAWQWAAGSVYYILGLWSRMVSSMPYLRGDKPSQLDIYVPRITKAYITSRLESVQAVVQQKQASNKQGGVIVEDMLDNEEQLQEQFDSLPFLCRFHYESLSKYLCTLADPLIKAFADFGATGIPAANAANVSPPTSSSNPAAAAGADGAQQLLLLEGQLTWIVYIIGSVVRGRLNSSSAESQESIDGELSARVFALLRVMDAGYHAQGHRYSARSRQRLDKAMLSFFQNFRKVYVGEQAIHSSKVYAPLKEHVGISDHLTALDIIVNKIATNLKVFPQCEELVDLTLVLFQDLAAGYMSGKLLLKLNAINYILGHHTREHFPFLDEPDNTRHRTTFYATLGRLLYMDDSAGKFKAFVGPLEQVFQAIERQADDVAAFRSEHVKASLIGLFRDLRGIAMATNSRRTYALLFDWLYPDHMPLLKRTLEAYTDTPEVTTPLLKFFSEFVLNKTQRLAFEASSPNGIKLFWETSKVIVTHGSRVLQLGAAADPYAYKYKGMALCFTILLRSLAGNYVNFGVFELYGDRSLNDALDVTLRLALSIPLNHLMAYQKVARAYFQLVEILAHSHTAFLVGRDSATFMHIGTSLEAGLKSLDVSISSQCAAAIDSLAAFYFNSVLGGESQTAVTQTFAGHIRDNPGVFPSILKTLFEIVLFEDCSNQWSLSRPMLSLVLINEQVYNDLKMQIIASQPAEKQQRLASCFENLMKDVARTLESKNRDKFTQNLTIFRHDFRAKK